jgi:tyrosinase
LESLKYSDVVYTIENGTTVDRFAQLIELEHPSVHNFPHIFMGGTQIDVTFSSQDPWFFFHHCMLDYVFAVWQSRDWNGRTSALPSPQLFDEIRKNGWSMPTPNPNLDSTLHLAPVFENITAGEAMWPNRNGYCYRYE